MKIVYTDKNAYNLYFHSDTQIDIEERLSDIDTYMTVLPGVTSVDVERYAMVIVVGLLFDPEDVKSDVVHLMKELWNPDIIEELTADNVAKHVPFFKNAKRERDTLEAMLALFNDKDSPEA